MTYKLGSSGGIRRGAEYQEHIPEDPANRDYQEYLAWLAGGGVPEPPDPPQPPVDQADINNLERAVKALGLVTATWAGKTPAQLKAAFRTAWESLAP